MLANKKEIVYEQILSWMKERLEKNLGFACDIKYKCIEEGSELFMIN